MIIGLHRIRWVIRYSSPLRMLLRYPNTYNLELRYSITMERLLIHVIGGIRISLSLEIYY